jgi:signal transduction histidine kinase
MSMSTIDPSKPRALGALERKARAKSGRLALSAIKIRYRLPLLIGLVLTGIILAAIWASYEGVKGAALEVGNERLVHLTDQLANLLQQSSGSLTGKTLTAASDSAIREFLQAPSPMTKSAAATALDQFVAPKDQTALDVELWSADASLLLVLPKESSTKPIDLSAEFKKCATDPFKTVGAIRLVNDTAAFPVVVAARNEQGRVIGYLVRWRKLSSTPDARKQLTELLGSEATLYIGNAQGDVWTDMVTIVPKPPVDLATTLNVTQFKRDGQSVIGRGRPIAGTPWFVVIEFSRQAVVSPATRFLRRTLIIGLVLLLIGVAATFWMSSSITRPLNSLTEVASAISGGDYSRKANIHRKDELGALASAFNIMVAQLGDSHRELEGKVQQRTAELEAANKQLEHLSHSNVLKRTEAEREKTEAIDALRITEEQLQQAQKLEAVGRLAGGIAHDFNNLLTAIIGYSDITLKRLPDADPLKNNIEEIKKASDRAAALTRQLLAFSRKQVLQPKVLDLNSVVSDLQKMLARMIGEDIELRTSLQPKLGSVKADPTQIEQVIMNLAINARDAMPKGGKVTIETANVTLDDAYARQHLAVTPGRYVMLAVADNGTGMNAETQRQIFEPFFTTKESGKGTGLGLSMVYGIVKQSGGNIWVYSEVGHGTTFKIYLPIAEGEATLSESVSEDDTQNATETVLLVEDEEVVRSLLLEVLQHEGYNVMPASSGAEALEVCASYKGPIHLLITDVVMPGMSGKQLVMQLVGKCRDMKVLYMSGYTDDAIVNHGVLDPGVAFLQKPFTPGGVLTKVREVLNSA